MEIINASPHASDVRLTRPEVGLGDAALNELLNGVALEEPEFRTRVGETRSSAEQLFLALRDVLVAMRGE